MVAAMRIEILVYNGFDEHVDDGDLISSGGVTSGLDMGLWLVERFAGETLAQEISAAIEYTRQGRVWQSGRKRATVEGAAS
jgi:transcriptional regulator GlxA family with amidase domain